MNYTRTYKKIYKKLNQTNLPHEKIHSASLRITEALNDIYVFSKENFPDLTKDIAGILEQTCSEIKFGGYDLDDKGQPLK